MTDSKLDFKDLVLEVVLEDDSSYAALLRWRKRYPEYRDQLTDFFVTWAIQKARFGTPDRMKVDRDAIVTKGVAHALNILRRQGRIVDPVPLESVSPLEQLVLAAIYLLQGARKGYSVKINDKVNALSGRRTLLGSTLDMLITLEDRGLISGYRVEGEQDPSGKTRTYYTVTLIGEQVLALARQSSTEVANFLGDFA